MKIFLKQGILTTDQWLIVLSTKCKCPITEESVILEIASTHRSTVSATFSKIHHNAYQINYSKCLEIH